MPPKTKKGRRLVGCSGKQRRSAGGSGCERDASAHVVGGVRMESEVGQSVQRSDAIWRAERRRAKEEGRSGRTLLRFCGWAAEGSHWAGRRWQDERPTIRAMPQRAGSAAPRPRAALSAVARNARNAPPAGLRVHAAALSAGACPQRERTVRTTPRPSLRGGCASAASPPRRRAASGERTASSAADGPLPASCLKGGASCQTLHAGREASSGPLQGLAHAQSTPPTAHPTALASTDRALHRDARSARVRRTCPAARLQRCSASATRSAAVPRWLALGLPASLAIAHRSSLQQAPDCSGMPRCAGCCAAPLAHEVTQPLRPPVAGDRWRGEGPRLAPAWPAAVVGRSQPAPGAFETLPASPQPSVPVGECRTPAPAQSRKRPACAIFSTPIVRRWCSRSPVSSVLPLCEPPLPRAKLARMDLGNRLLT
ncbi:hypothetical protein PSPO01_00043 [Paraphaeosphaeria sporulosa]